VSTVCGLIPSRLAICPWVKAPGDLAQHLLLPVAGPAVDVTGVRRLVDQYQHGRAGRRLDDAARVAGRRQCVGVNQ
jgi:hypothetical protein